MQDHAITGSLNLGNAPAQEQCKDQTFTSMNEALKVSCQQGLPVRVVRSYKVTRSVSLQALSRSSSHVPNSSLMQKCAHPAMRCWMLLFRRTNTCSPPHGSAVSRTV